MRKTFLFLLVIVALTVTAQNPIVQTWFTTDPAPLSYGDNFTFTGYKGMKLFNLDWWRFQN